MKTVFEDQAAAALDCRCGHREHEHAWDSQASPHITRIEACGHGDPLPREDNEPMVRFKFCPCEQYRPKLPAPCGNAEAHEEHRMVWQFEDPGPPYCPGIKA